MEKAIKVAGTSQLTSDGRNRSKNSPKVTSPFCQTMRVVMSPKGLKAPPALAATTTLMQATATNLGLPAPTAITTAPISRAVVRLSAMGEMQKARAPVTQNRPRSEKPRPTSQARSASNTRRSSRVLMKVMAASRNRKSSPNSSRLCRMAASAVCVSPARAYASPMSAQMRPAATMTGLDLRRCRASSPMTRA
ncbi:hypothetical protein D3C86_1665010 [compost metagenome]